MEIIEIWKEIPGYERLYEVSNFGNVRGITRVVKRIKGGDNGRLLNGKPKKISTYPNGYKYVILWKGRKGNGFLIHRLVAMAFLDNPESKRCVNHIDFNRANNRLSNLEWVTHKENIKHSIHEMGRGESHYLAKLNESKVHEVRQLRGVMSGCKVANKYGVTVSSIYNIWKNITWKHI